MTKTDFVTKCVEENPNILVKEIAEKYQSEHNGAMSTGSISQILYQKKDQFEALGRSYRTQKSDWTSYVATAKELKTELGDNAIKVVQMLQGVDLDEVLKALELIS